ncbi:MAG: CPXCG motif-containing cysteine-rich protein [Gemmatimonadaceae bacterium]
MISPLEDDFPLGDGPADLAATVLCPYCAEEVSIALDPGSGSSQEYVEDCPVCCQPWRVTVRYDRGSATVSVDALND